MPESSPPTIDLADTFTSRGNKFWHHPEALEGLRNGKPKPVVSHIMLTDTCQHTCAFCSVATREGNKLLPKEIIGYIQQLKPLGLKAVILSGGGNPILYKSAEHNDPGYTWDFNDVVDYLHSEGLEIGVITNGMPLATYPAPIEYDKTGERPSGRTCRRCQTSEESHWQCCYDWARDGRKSWKTVRPETLDKLTWVRISMSGLDHKENEVFVPDIDQSKTTLGFSYVAHDIYDVPEEPNHGKVSTPEDFAGYGEPKSQRYFDDRIPELTQQIGDIVRKHKPEYVRLLPNCLEPHLIDLRCEQLRAMADAIDPAVVFVQHKPPAAPPKCWLGYLHPVLNSDGYVYPCDSCVLNKTAGHKFAVPWQVCRWDEIGKLYAAPARSLIKDPAQTCPGCVFTRSNLLLQEVVDGAPLQPPQPVMHPNFV